MGYMNPHAGHSERLPMRGRLPRQLKRAVGFFVEGTGPRPVIPLFLWVFIVSAIRVAIRVDDLNGPEAGLPGLGQIVLLLQGLRYTEPRHQITFGTGVRRRRDSAIPWLLNSKA